MIRTFRLLIVCCIGLLVFSCSAIQNLFGSTKTYIEHDTYLNYYSAFLKDTTKHAVYIYSCKNKPSFDSLTVDFPELPKVYVVNRKLKKVYPLHQTDSISQFITKLNPNSNSGILPDTIPYAKDQYLKRILFNHTQTVFAHENFFMRANGNSTYDVYVIASTNLPKTNITPLTQLGELAIGTLHLIDLSIEKK